MKNLWSGVTLFTAITTSVFYSIYRKRFRQFVKKIDGEAQTFNSTFGTIQYAQTGEGPPLLFSHGGSCGYNVGLLIARFYPGLRVIAPSRFGYLRSAMPQNPSPQLQAEAYVQLLDKLGIERCSILGTSGGGSSSLYFAINFPDRCSGLILQSAITKRLPAFKPWTKIVYRIVLTGFINRLLSFVTTDIFIKKGLGLNEKEFSYCLRNPYVLNIARYVIRSFPSTLRAKGTLWDVSYLSMMVTDIAA